MNKNLTLDRKIKRHSGHYSCQKDFLKKHISCAVCGRRIIKSVLDIRAWEHDLFLLKYPNGAFCRTVLLLKNLPDLIPWTFLMVWRYWWHRSVYIHLHGVYAKFWLFLPDIKINQLNFLCNEDTLLEIGSGNMFYLMYCTDRDRLQSSHSPYLYLFILGHLHCFCVSFFLPIQSGLK